MVPNLQPFFNLVLVSDATKDLLAVLLHMLRVVVAHELAIEKREVERSGDGASPEAALYMECTEPDGVVAMVEECGCAQTQRTGRR